MYVDDVSTMRRSNLKLIVCLPSSPGGGTGRHPGLKILWEATPVPVRVRPRAHWNGGFVQAQIPQTPCLARLRKETLLRLADSCWNGGFVQAQIPQTPCLARLRKETLLRLADSCWNGGFVQAQIPQTPCLARLRKETLLRLADSC
jgi:hypothetical protein